MTLVVHSGEVTDRVRALTTPARVASLARRRGLCRLAHHDRQCRLGVALNEFSKPDLTRRWPQRLTTTICLVMFLRWLIIGLVALTASWVVMIILARRLPPGLAKDLATVLPACVTTARRLRKDPRVPKRVKFAVGFAGL